ncbi:hypothetical protein L228DRAFT_45236 [Xylona heveae TC161]|uniref:Uncharacterized protein n=1 Tax=Xylona heveae (strain CBS 132557 / TC161) TaxID=1328760 RepID=A0A164ZU26_XYLHT|nr:hypothetical protein L228DRAFT_45236 [Xylona heveae TC161]KZF19517.1 hypothetical protein L228DRAFT_45236 [Xylona heveae TC161]
MAVWRCTATFATAEPRSDPCISRQLCVKSSSWRTASKFDASSCTVGRPIVCHLILLLFSLSLIKCPWDFI